MRKRTTLVLLAGLLACPAAAHAAGDVTVRAVADPVPTGQAGSYGLHLKATVVDDDPDSTAGALVRFALSRDRRLDAGDPRVPLVRTEALEPDVPDTVQTRWEIPRSVEPGIYHVLACTQDGCAVANETVAVTEPGGDTTRQAGEVLPGATPTTYAPRGQWFPETAKLDVSAPSDCPTSLHGQGEGRCVWVKTSRDLRAGWEDRRNRSEFWYCPTGYPYPFEVALGFDPMWRNIGTESDAVVETVAAKRWTAYRSALGRGYYPSYGGSPSQGERGYVSIEFTAHVLASDHWAHRVEYLCSSKHATSMLP